MLTREQIEKSLPVALRSAATQSLTDMVNNAVSDPILAEQIRDNFLSYTKVLQEGRFKIEDYLNAVTYVSFKLMNYSNKDAYCRTFPQRHAQLLAKGTSDKDLSAYVAAYARGKLVNLILEQTLIPVWVTNHAVYQEAINTQADLMRTAQSEMVRTTAANSILTHLAKPKEAAALVQVNVNESSGMNELKDTLLKLAEQQQQLIQAGVSTKSIAAQDIIDVKARDVTT